ncbi:MAG TPA: hypothetical protein VG944_11740 [Fimbriimonas sp.]|nr:hypothetical protein [Fimbriimonas sp.]
MLVAVLPVGCRQPEDEYQPAVSPKVYSFEGQPDSKFDGNWSTDDGNSKMYLAKDGGMRIETTVRSVAGKAVTKVAGKWAAKDGALMFQYSAGAQPSTVIKYDAVLNGATLSLQQPGGHLKSVYTRKN